MNLLPEGIETSDIYPYSFNLMDISRYYHFDENMLCLNSESIMEAEVVGGYEYLSFTYHSLSLGLENVDAEIYLMEFRREKPDATVFMEIVDRREDKIKYKISFYPQLETNEVAYYKVKWAIKNPRNFCLEEQKLKYKDNPSAEDFCTLSRSIDVPIKKLVSRAVFPIGYNVHRPPYHDFFMVRKKRHMIEKEQQRIKKYKYFTKKIVNDCVELCLSVENPILDVSYSLIWYPPTLEQLLQSNLINKEQVVKIKDNMSKDESSKDRVKKQGVSIIPQTLDKPKSVPFIVLGLDIVGFSRGDFDKQLDIFRELSSWLNSLLIESKVFNSDNTFPLFTGDGLFLIFTDTIDNLSIEVLRILNTAIQTQKFNTNSFKLRYIIHCGKVYYTNLDRGLPQFIGTHLNEAFRIMSQTTETNYIMVSDEFYEREMQPNIDQIKKQLMSNYIIGEAIEISVKHNEKLKIRVINLK